MSEMNLFDDFFSGDFFGVTETPGKTKPAKKSDPKKKSESKEKDSKKETSQNKKLQVKLPVTIYGRGFKKVVDGEGEKDLETILKEQSNGNPQLYSFLVTALYVRENNAIYVGTSNIPDAQDTLINSDVTVADGEYNCIIELEDIAEGEEVTLKQVQTRFLESMPEYEGLKGLQYDNRYDLLVVCMDEVTVLQPGPVVVNVFGEEKEFLIEEEEKAADFVKKHFEEIPTNARPKLQKVGKTAYLAFYPTAGTTTFQRTEKGKVEPKKIKEPTYPTTSAVLIVNMNMRYELNPSMFGGKEHVKKEELVTVLSEYEPIFHDTSRKLDIYYDEAKGVISCMFLSGTKGADGYQLADGSDIWDTSNSGLWKLVRSTKELAQKFQEEHSCGIWAEGRDQFKFRSTPIGVFLGYYGHELQCCDVVKTEFRRKAPKIPASIYQAMVDYFREDLTKEAIVRILWNPETNDFQLLKGSGEKGKSFLAYDFEDMNKFVRVGYLQMCEIHSHNTMPAYFSKVDDADELLGMGLYGVMGKLDRAKPEFLLRCCMDNVGSEMDPLEIFKLS